MFSWGSRRKFLYISTAVFFGACALVIIGIFVFFKGPTCNDGKQNSDEQGIDCGGSCLKVCVGVASDLRINWARVFKVKDGVYSVVAYIENPNADYQAYSVPYHFKVYDSSSVLVAESSGATFVPAGQAFGVFEGGIFTNGRTPARALFEWTDKPVWEKVATGPEFLLVRGVLRSTDSQGAPRITAAVENHGLRPIKNIVGFVVVYDNSGNAIASSKTVINSIDGGGEGNFVFSWPAPFQSSIGRVEILHWILP